MNYDAVTGYGSVITCMQSIIQLTACRGCYRPQTEAKKEVTYAIVLAAFGNIDAAKNYQSGIKEDTYIFTSDGKYEVRYGRYTSKEDAKADINNFSWKDAEIVIIEE